MIYDDELMHWRPKGSKNGQHLFGKAQNPNKYVNGTNTLGLMTDLNRQKSEARSYINSNIQPSRVDLEVHDHVNRSRQPSKSIGSEPRSHINRSRQPARESLEIHDHINRSVQPTKSLSGNEPRVTRNPINQPSRVPVSDEPRMIRNPINQPSRVDGSYINPNNQPARIDDSTVQRNPNIQPEREQIQSNVAGARLSLARGVYANADVVRRFISGGGERHIPDVEEKANKFKRLFTSG